MLRITLVILALGVALPARAQHRLTDADVTWSYTSPRTPPMHSGGRGNVGGPVTVGIGGLLLVTTLLWAADTCDAHPFCLLEDARPAIEAALAGIGGLLVIIGLAIWANSVNPPMPAAVALTGGPGDVGAGLRVRL
jgi:hypothetical protein